MPYRTAFENRLHNHFQYLIQPSLRLITRCIGYYFILNKKPNFQTSILSTHLSAGRFGLAPTHHPLTLSVELTGSPPPACPVNHGLYGDAEQCAGEHLKAITGDVLTCLVCMFGPQAVLIAFSLLDLSQSWP